MLLKNIWETRHKDKYHPDVNGIIDRIQNDIDKSNSLFEEWGY